jgi:hypothetical protein
MTHTDARLGASCPSQETLAAFLVTSASVPVELTGDWPGVSDEQMQALSRHLAVCDRCVEELRAASHRLALANEIAAPVPSELVARVNADLRPRARVAPLERFRPLVALRDWAASTLRLPVLVPAALAALALIVVVPRLQQWTSSDAELSRAVELRQVARITVEAAAVHSARDTASPVLTTLVRGDRAVLNGEQDDWYRVELADGAEGWIERNAFD